MRSGEGPQNRTSLFLTATIAWVMIVMMSVPGNPDYFITGVLVSGDANPVTRNLWLAIGGLSVAILLWRISMTLRLVLQVNVFFLLIHRARHDQHYCGRSMAGRPASVCSVWW